MESPRLHEAGTFGEHFAARIELSFFHYWPESDHQKQVEVHENVLGIVPRLSRFEKQAFPTLVTMVSLPNDVECTDNASRNHSYDLLVVSRSNQIS